MKTISLFDDAVEYYRNSGLSRDGRAVLSEKCPKYQARQAAIDCQRKWWNREIPSTTDYEDDPSKGILDNAADQYPSQEDTLVFNDLVHKMLKTLSESEVDNKTDGNMTKMLFVKIRRAGLEQFLDQDLLSQCLQVCGDADPETDFEEAVAMSLKDVNRGKSHSNVHSRVRHCMQESLKKAGLAA